MQGVMLWFALVGIAGEDDMDAPELGQPNTGLGRLGRSPGQVSSAAANETGSAKLAANLSMLPATESNAEYERLIAELAVTTRGQLAVWARKSLPARGTLSADDAKRLELAFT